MAISDLVVKFGAAGSPQTVTMVEQLYAAFPVGFGSVTQERWRSDSITVGGIPFTVYALMDSDGRASVEVYAAYGEASAQQTYSAINRESASVDLQVTLNGVAQNLFGAGTTYSYDHQRSTWLRWQSIGLPWQTSAAFIQARIEDGTFLRHDSRNVMGGQENSNYTDMPTVAAYQPFKTFSNISQAAYIGDQVRGARGGGERTSIGPVHEWFARLISEVGTNENPSWLTATRLQILKDLAETASQFPHASGMIDPLTGRLLDPSVKPHCSHENPIAWFSATGIPQPEAGTPSTLDCGYDNSHPLNKFSFEAWHLSHDPLFLLHTQGQAITALTYSSIGANGRGTDGKTLRLGFDQERALWWGLQMLVKAWHATPSGTMPKPFRDKAWFATAINNTLQQIRDKFISSTTHVESGALGEAMRFWRITSHMGYNGNGEYFASRFQEDYGNIVLAHALLLGFTSARDVAEWHVLNIKRRLDMGGSWFLNDQQYWEQTSGFSGYAFCTTSGTMPYSTLAEFKAWYPYKTGYTNGPITATYWYQQYGRDTYLALAAVNVTKEAARRGLLTPGFDVAAAETELRARFVGPYTFGGTESGSPLNRTVYAKQYYSYTNDTTTPPSGGITMAIADHVKDFTTTTGTGAFALAGTPPLNHVAFLTSPITVGATVPYSVNHTTMNEWENGIGTLTSELVLERTTVTSSSSGGAKVNFSAGTKEIACVLHADMINKFARLDSSTSTTVVDSATTTVMIEEDGVAKRITLANLLAAIGTEDQNLDPAGALADADIVAIVQGGVAKRTTLAALKTYMGVPAADTTAPTLSSPTASSTGTTTASGSVSTNEGNGTLYYLVSTGSTATATAVKAGSSQAVSATGAQNVNATGLTASTTYYIHYLHRDAAGNDSAVASSASFTTSAAGDTTAPALSSPTGTQTGSTTASGTVSTNEANGTLYRYVSTNSTETATTIKAANITSAVTATGVQNVTFTGLTASTTYYAHYVHRDAAGNDSAVASSASFTTAAAAAATYTVTGHSGNAAKTTYDATSAPTSGSIKYLTPGQPFTDGYGYFQIKKISDNTDATYAYMGWSSSSTTPPPYAGAGVPNTGANAGNKLVDMSKPGAFQSLAYLWLDAGSGPYYLWAQMPDGSYVKPNLATPLTVSGV